MTAPRTLASFADALAAARAAVAAAQDADLAPLGTDYFRRVAEARLAVAAVYNDILNEALPADPITRAALLDAWVLSIAAAEENKRYADRTDDDRRRQAADRAAAVTG